MGLFERFRKLRVDRHQATNLMNQIKHETDQMNPINIIVAGKTGSGKSTLINALFREQLAATGVGQPITQHLEKITKEGVPLTLYDTKGLELTPEAQRDVLVSLNDLIKSQKEKGEREQIDLAYYCLNSMMARIEPFEIELIQALSEHIPVILVLTQHLGAESGEFETYLQEQDLPVKGIVPVLAKPYLIQDQHYIPSHGLERLIDTTLELVPKEVHRAFINAQQIDLNLKVNEARSWAKRYVGTAFGIGFTPIPVADATVLVPMQIGMLGHITAIFGLSLDKSQIVSMLAGIGGTGGATLLGKYIVGQVFKALPGVGTVTGSVISGATASSLTLALAYSYIEVLRQITIAELSGRDLALKEIQKVMNANFSDQLKQVSQFLPEQFKDHVLPEWARSFISDDKK